MLVPCPTPLSTIRNGAMSSSVEEMEKRNKIKVVMMAILILMIGKEKDALQEYSA